MDRPQGKKDEEKSMAVRALTKTIKMSRRIRKGPHKHQEESNSLTIL